jgi:hypothetical protein
MALVAAERVVVPAGWLRGREFDLVFILGIAMLACAAGALAVGNQQLFVVILLGDLWLLGYHHVVATFTRLCFDRASRREHRFILFVLPPLVAGGVAALVFGIGAWTLPSLYFYWQWFHYTRQSWGVSQVYRRKAGGIPDEDPLATKLVIYLVPLVGVLYRSAQNPSSFLGLELRMLPVPDLAVDFAGLAALAAIAWWATLRVQAWRRGQLPVAHTLYVASHVAIFLTGYLLIDDISVGWLVVNVWHNAQYVLFVWLFNNNRFRGGIEPKARFLSMLSQTRNVWLYFAVCVGISTAVYLALQSVIAAVPILMAVYQAINFHHYIADSVIWKVRKPALQKTLGISG